MKKRDIILIAAILFIGISGMFAVRIINNGNSSKTAVISIDNREVKRIPVSDVKGEKTFSFKFGGNIGYIDVKDGAVRIEEMDLQVCPEKICSDTGWISEPYETIVCLPNRITVNIENGKTVKDNSNLIDGAAY